MPRPKAPYLLMDDFLTIADALFTTGQYQLASQPGIGAHVEFKGDHSPVTEVDKKSDATLRMALGEIGNRYPVLSEEASEEENLKAMQSEGPIWAVDPLDGTRSYIDGHGGYTISLGLLSEPDARGNRTPVFGAVYAPATQKLYFTHPATGEAFVGHLSSDETSVALRTNGGKLELNPNPPHKHDALHVVSGFNDQQLGCFTQGGRPVATGPAVGAARALIAAEDNADAASLGFNTCIWDTAGTDAILRAAGGRFFPVDNTRGAITGTSLYYGTDTTRYVQGQPFANEHCIGLHDAMARRLHIPSDVALPRTPNVALHSR